VRATVAMGKPHEQATALALLSERSAAPLAAVQLTHGIPIVRYYAERALATLLARPITIDLFQDNEAIRAQASALLREAGLAPLSPTPGPAAGLTSPPAQPAQIEE
jgi:hypothetical protein